MVQISRPGSNTNYTYTTSGALEQINHLVSGISRDYAQYSYDHRNFPVQKRTVSGDYNYQYDSNGQLVTASHPSLAAEVYTYDSLGNRLTDHESMAYGYDSKGQRLLEDGVYNYQYDNNGNLLSKLNKDANKEG